MTEPEAYRLTYQAVAAVLSDDQTSLELLLNTLPAEDAAYIAASALNGMGSLLRQFVPPHVLQEVAAQTAAQEGTQI